MPTPRGWGFALGLSHWQDLDFLSPPWRPPLLGSAYRRWIHESRPGAPMWEVGMLNIRPVASPHIRTLCLGVSQYISWSCDLGFWKRGGWALRCGSTQAHTQPHTQTSTLRMGLITSSQISGYHAAYCSHALLMGLRLTAHQLGVWVGDGPGQEGGCWGCSLSRNQQQLLAAAAWMGGGSPALGQRGGREQSLSLEMHYSCPRPTPEDWSLP